MKVDDLKPEMQLDAQVVNVVDFGVFVDIGMGESCLVHVSQLSHRFIRNPQQLYAVGDPLRVWVTDIENDKRRVKLTAIRPGSPKPTRPPRRGRKPESTGTTGARTEGAKTEGAKTGGARTGGARTGGARTGGVSRRDGASSSSSSSPARTDGRPSRREGQKSGKYSGGGYQGNKGPRERKGAKPPGPGTRTVHRTNRKKEVKPITQDMLDGAEPMRSFSDLLQFVEKKPEKTGDKKDNNES